jgi:hypothetical protein
VHFPEILESVYWVVQKFCETPRYFVLGALRRIRAFVHDPGILGIVVWVLDNIVPYSRNSGIGIQSNRNSVVGPEFLDQMYWVVQKFCETSRYFRSGD